MSDDLSRRLALCGADCTVLSAFGFVMLTLMATTMLAVFVTLAVTWLGGAFESGRQRARKIDQ
jgi:hypothetical protein